MGMASLGLAGKVTLVNNHANCVSLIASNQSATLLSFAFFLVLFCPWTSEGLKRRQVQLNKKRKRSVTDHMHDARLCLLITAYWSSPWNNDEVKFKLNWNKAVIDLPENRLYLVLFFLSFFLILSVPFILLLFHLFNCGEEYTSKTTHLIY